MPRGVTEEASFSEQLPQSVIVLIRSLQQLDVFLKLNKALRFSALGTVASPDNITSYSGP